LISRSGIIPIAHSQDTAGPMTRSVADAAAMLSGMTGADAADPITGERATSALDYTSYLQTGTLQGKRIGVLRHLSGRNPAVDQLLELQLAVLRAGGATLVDLYPEIPAEMGNSEYQVLLYEFKYGINQYLSQRGGETTSLADLIAFNEANAEQEMPWFAQEIFVQAQEKGDLTQPEYLEALSYSKLSSKALLDQLLESEQLDALVAPSNGPGWKIDLENGDNGGSVNYVSSASLAAISGYPSITVPAGFINDLPVGISFIGAAFSEPELIAIAYDYEQRSQARRAPRLTLQPIDPAH
jgi:amidase